MFSSKIQNYFFSYSIMSNCWKKFPKDRPTFTELRIALEKLLENVGDYLHLDVMSCKELNSSRSSKCLLKNKKTTSSERYVKPINVLR